MMIFQEFLDVVVTDWPLSVTRLKQTLTLSSQSKWINIAKELKIYWIDKYIV